MAQISDQVGDAISRMLIYLSMVFVVAGVMGFLFSIEFQPSVRPESPISPTPKPSCKRSGCGFQLCISATEEPVVSTCEWKAEYACYREATCELQPDGGCGFTNTEALTTCLDNAQSK